MQLQANTEKQYCRVGRKCANRSFCYDSSKCGNTDSNEFVDECPTCKTAV